MGFKIECSCSRCQRRGTGEGQAGIESAERDLGRQGWVWFKNPLRWGLCSSCVAEVTPGGVVDSIVEIIRADVCKALLPRIGGAALHSDDPKERLKVVEDKLVRMEQVLLSTRTAPWVTSAIGEAIEAYFSDREKNP